MSRRISGWGAGRSHPLRAIKVGATSQPSGDPSTRAEALAQDDKKVCPRERVSPRTGRKVTRFCGRRAREGRVHGRRMPPLFVHFAHHDHTFACLRSEPTSRSRSRRDSLASRPRFVAAAGSCRCRWFLSLIAAPDLWLLVLIAVTVCCRRFRCPSSRATRRGPRPLSRPPGRRAVWLGGPRAASSRNRRWLGRCPPTAGS